MVLPAPPAHATSVEPHWFDKIVVAIELSAHGALTLVDHAAPSQLREAFLRLRAHDPATDLIVDVQRLPKLPPGATVILAVTPSITSDALDWLNLNRPLVADHRLNLVLWCESDAAAVLARGAPDFFDWISARVDCPPAPAAFAVADVKAAIRARAPGIAWAGPGLEETLAAVRPSRPIRRVAVASYQSMIDALTSREPGWLYLDGIDTAFHLRRLRWAMAETWRRVIVFRRAIDHTLPGWWTVHAEHMPIVEAVLQFSAAGGTGRLAALTGLDSEACAHAAFLLHHGSESARLEDLLAGAADPRAMLQDRVRMLGWTAASTVAEPSPGVVNGIVRQGLQNEVMRNERGEPPTISEPSHPGQWLALGTTALGAEDFEVAIRWLTSALRSAPENMNPWLTTVALAQRGRAYTRAGELSAARADLERAHAGAYSAGDASLIALCAVALGNMLVLQGEPARARESLESALNSGASLSDDNTADVLESLGQALVAQGELPQAHAHFERALTLRRSTRGTDEDPSIALSLTLLGAILAEQGDTEGALRELKHSLAIWEHLGPTEHPAIGVTLSALSEIHRKRGDLATATSHLNRALAIQRTALGPDHPDLADTLVELASVLAARGDPDGAQSALQNALAMQQRAFGDDGQLAGAKTRRELANVLVARGDLTGAIENLQRTLATLYRIFERDDHASIAAVLRELRRLQSLQCDLQRAD